jgi:hypothetical protein
MLILLRKAFRKMRLVNPAGNGAQVAAGIVGAAWETVASRSRAAGAASRK